MYNKYILCSLTLLYVSIHTYASTYSYIAIRNNCSNIQRDFVIYVVATYVHIVATCITLLN